jgi:hypothetical protein
MSKRDEAVQKALDDYWGAQSHAEEHHALQRMMALGHDGGGFGPPCLEPECIALREATLASIEDISDITRAVARRV